MMKETEVRRCPWQGSLWRVRAEVDSIKRGTACVYKVEERKYTHERANTGKILAAQ